MKNVLQLAKALRLDNIVGCVTMHKESKEAVLKPFDIRDEEFAETITEDLDLDNEDTMGIEADQIGNPLIGKDCVIHDYMANPEVQQEEVNNNQEEITVDSAGTEEILAGSVNQDDQSSTTNTNMLTVATTNSLTDQEVTEFIKANDEFTQICSSLPIPSNDSNLEESVQPVSVVPPIKPQPPVASVPSKPKSSLTHACYVVDNVW